MRRMMQLLVCTAAVAFVACGEKTGVVAPSTPPVTPPTAFTTIQNAIAAAAAGGTVVIPAGTYGERLTVAKPLTLQGSNVTLDGLKGLDGRDVGIRVTANDVTITGLIVQNFERGVVVDHVANCHLRNNEIRNNASKDPQPIAAGVTKADGITLLQAQNCEVVGNNVHDNGSIGLMIWDSSGGNLVQGNRFTNNGWQQIAGFGQYGAGIFSQVGNNTRNLILDNEVSGSDWGVILGSGADSANVVRNNRIHDNHRAGVYAIGQHNTIEGNDATGNGTLNLTPTCRLDLADFDVVDNTWINNTGVFGLAAPFQQLSLPCH